MPDVLDANGLQTKTLSELRAELEGSFRAIYGADINLAPDTPDGQFIGILAQFGADMREFLQLIYASFDPDQAPGRQLDQRVALNGIARLGGSYTTVDVEITTDRALTLVGLDAEIAVLDPTIDDLYTVRDSAGMQFYLAATEVIAAAGTYTLAFRARRIGQVLVSPNTITTPVTTVRGITAVNNPAGATTTGVDQESDAELRERRRISFAISSQGYLDSIQAALANLDGVTEVIVLENATSVPNSDGVPPHSIWVIVEGGDNAEIAEAIYARKSAGSGMFGAVSVSVPRAGGAGDFVARFDRPTNVDLWIELTVSLPGGTVDTAALKALIAANVSWEIGADARSSIVTSYVQSLNEDYVITAVGVSDDDVTYSEVVSAAGPDERFINDTTRITIS